MTDAALKVALVRDVFVGPGAARRLEERLAEARAAGAELALLPELPLNAWCGALRQPRDEDAEPAGGSRHQSMAAAARAAGIGLIGGAIVRDGSGQRFNTALVFDREGRLVSSYRKLHLPEEEGFWETSHYEPGSAPPEVVESFGLPIGIEICSDVNRPELAHALAGAGAFAIFAPRATEAATFDRWRLVLRATALTCAAWVLSVPRPAPEDGVPLGGPSIAISPDGEVLVESTERLSTVTLERAAVERARRGYPGYLAVRSDVYARAWQGVPPSLRPHQPSLSSRAPAHRK
jgi:predicted amidohydrolase